MRSTTRRGDREPSFFARIFISVFALVFTGAALLLVALAWREARIVVRERFDYESAPATIVAVEIVRGERSNLPYEPRIICRFEHQGRLYEHAAQGGESLFRARGYTSFEAAREATARYPVGAVAPVYFDPADPRRAQLELTSFVPSIASALFALVFSGFALLSVAAAASAWRGKREGERDALPEGILARRAPRTAGRRLTALGMLGGAVFCSIFVAAPVWILRDRVLLPRERARASFSWAETACTIERVDIVDDGDGAERLDVLYRYDFGGREYRASRHDFSDHLRECGERRAVYRSLRGSVGSTIACYVDPGSPHEAVIDRALPPFDWKEGAFLGAMAAFGGLVALGFARGAWRTWRGDAAPAERERTTSVVTRTAGPIRLPLDPRRDPSGQARATAAVVDAWMGDVRKRRQTRASLGALGVVFLAGFTALWMKPVLRGTFDIASIFAGVTGIPLVIITTGLAYVTWRAWRTMRLPVPAVTLPAKAAPGEVIDVEWSLEGELATIASVRLALEGSEVINLGSESGPRQTAIIARVPIADRAGFGGRSSSYRDRVRIPEGAMVSCEGDEWRIEWNVHLDLVLREGSTQRESFALRVVFGEDGP